MTKFIGITIVLVTLISSSAAIADGIVNTEPVNRTGVIFMGSGQRVYDKSDNATILFPNILRICQTYRVSMLQVAVTTARVYKTALDRGIPVDMPYDMSTLKAVLANATKIEHAYNQDYSDALGLRNGTQVLRISELTIYCSEAGTGEHELLDSVEKIKVLDGPYQGRTGYAVAAVSDPGPGVPEDPYVGRNFTCEVPNVNATVTSAVQPAYPPSAQEKRLPAVTVVVEVTIGPTGAVQNAVIYRSSGDADIDASALRAAQQSTYSPKHFHCKPVTGKFLFRADFQPD